MNIKNQQQAEDNAKGQISLAFKFEAESFQTKDDATGSFGMFSGYASTFNGVDSYGDTVAQGAFTDSIKANPTVVLLWQHDMYSPIGSVDLSQDSTGLKAAGRINLGTTQGRDAYALVKAGDMSKMSIGYRVKDYHFDNTTKIRTLKALDVAEVSVVTFPANKQAKILSVKASDIEDAKSLADIEDVLKNNGFSNKQAKALVGRVKSIASGHRDGDANASRDAKDDEAISASAFTDLIQQFKKDLIIC